LLSGWSAGCVEGQFAGYNVAAYFSEFGCITSPPRLWTEVGALFSTEMTNVWSGGIAFSYFPAASGQGQFGMVTISADGSTVTTSADFTALATQYGSTTPANSPSQAAAGATTYPACPQQNSSFLASTTLPPTPNDAACNCLENTLSCRFTPADSNYSQILGTLLDTACGLLGQAGGNCNDIASNGSSGTYGRVSSCDPSKNSPPETL
jgi:1,3-beta-glucanosyltransferase GAS1